MFCQNCSKLAYVNVNKPCVRCNGNVTMSIGILCEFCSRTEKKCAVCVKTIVTDAERQARRGCNCGSK